MGAAVDHLGADKLVRVLCRFEDATGAAFEAGETGRIRLIHFDWATSELTIELVQGEDLRKIVLHSHNSKISGPRSGNLRQYFEVTGEEFVWEPQDGGDARYLPPPAAILEPEDVWIPQLEVIRIQKPIATRTEREPQMSYASFTESIDRLEREDRMEEVEKLFQERIDHAQYALEIATVYRSRWRRFKIAGDLVRAEEARTKASSWAYTFAGFATSGGEGAAFSRERDQFLGTLK